MSLDTPAKGPTRYWVWHPDEVAEPFSFTLSHSRERKMLDALIRAGATGCNFYDDPAPRWAASIHKLRKRGLIIETVRERHEGEFPGHHARYVMRSMVKSEGEAK